MSEKKKTLKSAMAGSGKVSSIYSIYFYALFLESMSDPLYTSPNKDNPRGNIAFVAVTWVVFRMALVSSYQVCWG